MRLPTWCVCLGVTAAFMISIDLPENAVNFFSPRGDGAGQYCFASVRTTVLQSAICRCAALMMKQPVYTAVLDLRSRKFSTLDMLLDHVRKPSGVLSVGEIDEP